MQHAEHLHRPRAGVSQPHRLEPAQEKKLLQDMQKPAIEAGFVPLSSREILDDMPPAVYQGYVRSTCVFSRKVSMSINNKQL